MKYTKHIVFLISINLIVVLISIFVGNITREIEINNKKLKQNIINEKDQLIINKVEFSLHNNPNYLKKLHKIYFSIDEQFSQNKIISFSEILNKKGNNFILVNIKSKKSDQ